MGVVQFVFVYVMFDPSSVARAFLCCMYLVGVGCSGCALRDSFILGGRTIGRCSIRVAVVVGTGVRDVFQGGRRHCWRDCMLWSGGFRCVDEGRGLGWEGCVDLSDLARRVLLLRRVHRGVIYLKGLVSVEQLGASESS